MRIDIRRMSRRAFLAAVLLASACATAGSFPPVVHDPTVAYPFTEATIRGSEVSSCAARLLKDGGYGRMPFERAAFLVLKEDDAFECRVWPATFQNREAEWDGPLPDGTAAVLHTHPARFPNPSTGDAREARRIGVPVLVVTPGLVSMVSPSTGAVSSFTTRKEALGRMAGK